MIQKNSMVVPWRGKASSNHNGQAVKMQLISDRITFRLVGTWLATVMMAMPGVAMAASQSADQPKDSPANSVIEPNAEQVKSSQAADAAVLKLQAEKQDSIDRLEKTASEIARKWRARQAKLQELKERAAASKGDGTQSTVAAGTDSKDTISEQLAATPKVPDPDGKKPAGTPPEIPDPSEQPGFDQIPGGTSESPIEVTEDSDKTQIGVEEPGSERPSDESSEDSSHPLQTSSIVSGPIDRLALATSLFATNELRECLKILEAVDLRPLSLEDKQWHDYLQASCYRKLGNRSEAESLYRSVLKRSNTTWLSKAARWWLQHINDQAQLKLKQDQVQQTLANWRKEIDNLKSAH